MIFTTPMTQLFAVVLEKDKEQVTEALLREGVMQFITTSEFNAYDPDHQFPVKPEVSLTEVTELRRRMEGFLYTVGVVPACPGEADLNRRVPVDLKKEKTRLDQLDGKRENIRERQRQLQHEVLRLEDVQRQVNLYGSSLSGATLPAKQSLLSFATGKLPAAEVPNLEEGLRGLSALNVALGRQDDLVHHLVISMKRDHEKIERILDRVKWTPVELPRDLLSGNKDLTKEVAEKISALTEEQKRLQSQVEDLIKSEETRLTELWVNLRVNELCYRIQDHFESSARAVVFTGWLASPRKRQLEKAITGACGGRCFLEWQEAGSQDALAGDIPIQFNNPKMLAPFQMLVSNFGIPRYGTIDPTPFVMPLYLAMVGMMFADVGQGAIVALIGALGAIHFKDKVEKLGMCQLAWLLLWCGCASMLFGVLFGSCFGMGLFKPLWFDFHGIVSGHTPEGSVINDVYDILLLTLCFGIVVIFMGLLFNWVNLIRARQWMELVFDKGGLLGAWLYGGGIYIASYMVAHSYREFPAAPTLWLLAGCPAGLLFLKEPYHHLKHQQAASEQKSNPALVWLNFAMQWIVELLEIFSGYLSNTLSFMRVAGLGFAHVCLMIAFFTLADMTSNTVFRLLILVLGNGLVIGLEGLSAGIQALRLSYYEFFSKFFHETGKLHTPISLSSRQ